MAALGLTGFKFLMIDKNTDLLIRIMEFQFDSYEEALPFSKRLSRENGWSQEFADKCIREYKKFLYLLMTSEEELTPSDQVDQVWHLHLLYTKSYWKDLCQHTLEKEIDHIPTKGGTQESERFHDQYEFTLVKYQNSFSEIPPQDVWPSTIKRFSNVDKFIRINTAEFALRNKLYKNPIFILFIVVFFVSYLQDYKFMKYIAGIYIVIRLFEWVFDRPRKYKQTIKVSYNSDGGCGGCGGCGG
jgi:hypothetical protein